MRIFSILLFAICCFSFSERKGQNDLAKWGLKGKVKYLTQFMNYSGYDSLTGYPIKKFTTYFNPSGNKIWEISYHQNDTFFRDSFFYDHRNRLLEVRREFFPKLDSNGYRNSYLFYDKAVYMYENNLLASIKFIIPKQHDLPLYDFHFVFRHDNKGRIIEKRDMADTLEVLRTAYTYPAKNITETSFYQFSLKPHRLQIDSFDKPGNLVETRIFSRSVRSDSLWVTQKATPFDLSSIDKYDKLGNITASLFYDEGGKIEKTDGAYKTDNKKNWIDCTYSISGKLMMRYTRNIEYY